MFLPEDLEDRPALAVALGAYKQQGSLLLAVVLCYDNNPFVMYYVHTLTPLLLHVQVKPTSLPLAVSWYLRELTTHVQRSSQQQYVGIFLTVSCQALYSIEMLFVFSPDK